MSRHRSLFRVRVAAGIAAMLLVATGSFAQTPDGIGMEPNQPPGFVVSLLPGERVGNEQVIRGLIRSGTNEFMFVVPEGMRTQNPGEGTMVLTSQDMSYYLSIRIVGPAAARPGLQDALREQIASRLTNVSSLEEFTATVADREGKGFQLRQELPNGGGRLMRILWLPFKAGILEIALNACGNSALTGQGAFDMILLTFRSNERGRLEVVRRSEQT